MENCPNCGMPMEEGHVCADSEKAPEVDTLKVEDDEESDTPKMEA